VLLVDDEDSLRKVMRDLLERDGYDVTEARDGVQALDQVDRVGPDIIVLDLNLPGLDGYGVLSHLRSRPATANIPVIVLTAKGDEDNEVRVFELAPTTFLPSHSARALSRRVSKPCSAAAADFRSSVLRGHVRPARSGATLEVAGAAARSARPQRRIVGDGARHDRAGETPVQASLRELREENRPRAGKILQSQPHGSVLSAQARRGGADSGVRAFVRPVRA